LDIGANIGQFHHLSKMVFPESFVFSIEGSPQCEPYLANMTRDYKICLLGKEIEKVNFYVNKSWQHSTGNSIYRELTHHYSDDNIIVEERYTERLDDVFTNETFDLVKIDTQGSEIDIMKGGPNLISRATGVLLEVSITPYNEGAPLYDEVIDFMESINFYPVDVLEDHFDESGNIFQKDYLFMKK
jgi:FkbM family methyltransferase